MTKEEFNNLNETTQRSTLLIEGKKVKELDFAGNIMEYWKLYNFMVEIMVHEDGRYIAIEACSKEDCLATIEEMEQEYDESEITLAEFTNLCREDQENLMFAYGKRMGKLPNEKGTIEFWIMPNFYAEYYVETNGYPYLLKGFDDGETLKKYEGFLDIVIL